jgi:hypothetical protein
MLPFHSYGLLDFVMNFQICLHSPFQACTFTDLFVSAISLEAKYLLFHTSFMFYKNINPRKFAEFPQDRLTHTLFRDLTVGLVSPTSQICGSAVSITDPSKL